MCELEMCELKMCELTCVSSKSAQDADTYMSAQDALQTNGDQGIQTNGPTNGPAVPQEQEEGSRNMAQGWTPGVEAPRQVAQETHHWNHLNHLSIAQNTSEEAHDKSKEARDTSQSREPYADGAGGTGRKARLSLRYVDTPW
jgi:hypothetical protein